MIKIYKIKCITNLHVGSGEINYSIIDNEVQKDPVTGYPTIFSSSVKGALREHLKKIDFDKKKCIEMFGSEQGDNKTNIKQGLLKFTSAQLLKIPMRNNEGEDPYKMVYSETAKNQFNRFCEIMNYKINNDCFNDCEKLDCMEFNSLVNHLPVIARNQLNNGISENLWYEEFVPHESEFWFAVLYDGSGNDNLIDDFNNILMENKIVQFGANASIGVGFCLVEEIE